MILIDDTGSHRLTDTQRLRLMIALETEGEVTNEPLLPAGMSPSLTPRLVAAVAGEASESEAQEAPPVAEHDGPTNLQSAQAAVAV